MLFIFLEFVFLWTYVIFIQEKLIEFNDSILNHEHFSSLLAKLETLIDDIELEEAAFNLLFLR